MGSSRFVWILIIFFVVVPFLFPVSFRRFVGLPAFSLLAFAEDDDRETEHESDDEHTSSSSTPASSKKSSSTKSVIQTVTKTIVTYETKLVNDPEFLTDTDGDGLVDAIDPEPQYDQRKYFTDSDSDGVPDAFDQHPGEDDFAYHDDEDMNLNGILDSYEQ